MYLQFFDLKEAPFSLTPDPAFLYLSVAHRDALAHLLYGVGQGGAGGFVQLTGEVGTGKTTLCRCLMEQVPENTQVALILNPLVTAQELLATICEELGLEMSGIAHSNKAMVDALNHYLLEQHSQGRRVVVVIDEAQNLSPEALEQVRLLTNLETTKDKLLQMVLLGQPELRQLLQRQNLRQLSQRITARYHLAPLGQEESFAYVRHRMKVAGASRNPFSQSALRALYQHSAGVPRLINIIADRA
ncbi:MAG: AAA family ATPase, partial [Proteobacteria bacterium]|nr:AAA family ATPase [Pseudomonadota bacterium]